MAQAMKSLLTVRADRIGHDTHFVRRRSKLSAAGFAQTVVWGWHQFPAASLSILAQTASAVGIAITPQGLDQRFHERAATFLGALLREAMTTVVSADPVAIPLLRRFSAVLVRDSTVINLPDALAPVWPGCGDAAHHHLAALKVQVHCDLLTGTLCDVLLAAGRTHDRTCARALRAVPPGALCLADLGYFALAFLSEVAEHGAFFVSRLFPPTAVFTPHGTPLDLPMVLRAQTQWPVDLTVAIGASDYLPVRLVALPVSQEVAERRRQRLYDEARRRGQGVSRVRLALTDWTILLTNAPRELLAVADIIVLYRLRWQVELLFKLWKQHGQVDEWRSAQPWRILCEVYAKLLALLLQHWILITSCWTYPDRSVVKAATTIRAHTPLLTYAIATNLDLAPVLDRLRHTLAACPGQQRRRKSPAAYQLLLQPTLVC
jgi:hypothetical protein